MANDVRTAQLLDLNVDREEKVVTNLMHQNDNSRNAALRDTNPIQSKENAAKNPTANGDLAKPPSNLPSDLNKESSSLKTPTKKAKTPDLNSANNAAISDKKKVPMNKVMVGAAPSPNLKEVRSKIGSLENYTHKPGGGKVKIENRKLEWKVQPRIAAKNDQYNPTGGAKKIPQKKLQWNAKSKIGSLDNATHKPGGGDKKIESVKLDFKDKAKSKVGSKDNIKHTPGGGTVKTDADVRNIPSDIEDQKIEIKAQSKIGSLDNVKHRPGGGDKKIFDDKDYLKQAGETSLDNSNLPISGSQVIEESQSNTDKLFSADKLTPRPAVYPPNSHKPPESSQAEAARENQISTVEAAVQPSHTKIDTELAPHSEVTLATSIKNSSKSPETKKVVSSVSTSASADNEAPNRPTDNTKHSQISNTAESKTEIKSNEPGGISVCKQTTVGTDYVKTPHPPETSISSIKPADTMITSEEDGKFERSNPPSLTGESKTTTFQPAAPESPTAKQIKQGASGTKQSAVTQKQDKFIINSPTKNSSLENNSGPQQSSHVSVKTESIKQETTTTPTPKESASVTQKNEKSIFNSPTKNSLENDSRPQSSHASITTELIKRQETSTTVTPTPISSEKQKLESSSNQLLMKDERPQSVAASTTTESSSIKKETNDGATKTVAKEGVKDDDDDQKSSSIHSNDDIPKDSMQNHKL